jgi:hypothetical protein
MTLSSAEGFPNQNASRGDQFPSLLMMMCRQILCSLAGN